MRSTFGTVSVPYASAAIACAPPMRNRCVTPSHAAIAENLRRSDSDTRRRLVATPATCAGITVISSVDGSG